MGCFSKNTKYEKGQKWCTICSKFIKTQKLRCPDCNVLLRASSRNSKPKKEKNNQ